MSNSRYRSLKPLGVKLPRVRFRITRRSAEGWAGFTEQWSSHGGKDEKARSKCRGDSSFTQPLL